MTRLINKPKPSTALLGEQSYRFRRVLNEMHSHLRADEFHGSVSLLDLGCQIGDFLNLTRAHVDQHCSMYGSDQFTEQELPEISNKFFHKQINSYNEMTNMQWEYKPADFSKAIPYEASTMNIVTALEVIEHMVDTDFFLSEVHRILMPNGVLVLSTPNITSLRNRLYVPLGKYPAYLEYKNIIHHVRLYTPKMLLHHAAEHGFMPISISGVSFLPLNWLKSGIIAWFDSNYLSKLSNLCGNSIILLRKA